jgi:hypothetical protein
MPEKIGFMESGQQALPFNDLIIPDFKKLAYYKLSTFCFFGPNFILQDKQLSISGSCEPMSHGTVEIGLYEDSGDQLLVTIDKVSFSLVSDDGSELNIGSKTKVAFIIISDEIATFNMYSLEPNFLPNGELRIRCRMQIGLSEEKTLWKSIQGSSIVNDLNLQFAEQNLLFPDIVLVCCKKEFPVHR